MHTTLSQLPSAEGLYLKAATTAFKRPKGLPQIPQLSVQINGLVADARQLADYREICGFAASDTLPITFPHVMAGSLQLYLLTRAAFPLPLLGLVDIGARIEQRRAIGTGERCDLTMSLGASREVRQGLEFDRLASVTIDGEEVWREVVTTLYRMPVAKKAGTKPAAPPPAPLSEYLPVNAAADTGRRYAGVSKDFNPIHLTPLSAKLFGFKRHIAHGMWSAAHCAALLQARLGVTPIQLEVQFRQPLFLPGRAALKFALGGSAEQGLDFALLARNSDKIHLSGRLRGQTAGALR